MRRLLRPLLVLALTGALAGVAAGARVLDASESEDMLPDLAAAAPSDVQVRPSRKGGELRFLLSFESGAENVGEGELSIRSHRASRDDPTMTADQRIRLRNGRTRTVRGVGTTRYVVDPTHQHWHLDDAMAYELVRIDGEGSQRRLDEKTGFCLGDRYEISRKASGQKPSGARWDVNCGYDAPELLEVVEGISVGWGDNYEAWRDGQQIDITGLPAGRYRLVHRVNPTRRLLEERFGNNGSSAVLELSWPNGKGSLPDVTVLRSCRGTTRCAA